MRIAVVLLVAGCTFSPPDQPGAELPNPALAVDGAVEPVDAPPPPILDEEPWLEPWAHRKRITLRRAVGAPVENVPIALARNDADIMTTALPNATDLVFTGADRVTPLASEIETTSAQSFIAWVKIPVLSDAEETVIYAYYGNPAAVSAPNPTPAVWTEDFFAALHFSQDPGPGGANQIADAAGRHPGTAGNDMTPDDLVPGIGADRGYDFDGNNDLIDFPSADFGPRFTISMWIRPSNAAGSKTLLSNSPSQLVSDGFRLFVNANATADRSVHFETGNSRAVNSAETGSNVVATDRATHVAVTVDRAAGTARIFVDGVDRTVDASILTDFATASDYEVGRMEDQFGFVGRIDEVQIASVLRPAAWIRTAFENQRAPGEFAAFGPEEDRP
jgi:biopolymer transport protein ExbB